MLFCAGFIQNRIYLLVRLENLALLKRKQFLLKQIFILISSQRIYDIRCQMYRHTLIYTWVPWVPTTLAIRNKATKHKHAAKLPRPIDPEVTNLCTNAHSAQVSCLFTSSFMNLSFMPFLYSVVETSPLRVLERRIFATSILLK